MINATLVIPEPVEAPSFGLLGKEDFTPTIDLDALVQAASLACGTPISLVSLVGEDRQWFKAQVGLPGVRETTREVSFCAHTIQQDGLFEIPDALLDARFADNPLVKGGPKIRFYAGAPLQLRHKGCEGALCVIDTQPRHLDAAQRGILLHLAKVAAHLLENQRSNREFSLLLSEFRALDQSAPLGIYATDAHGLCVKVNTKWMAIYELNVEQSLGTGWTSRIHSDDRPAVIARWALAAKELQDFDMEFRLMLPGDRIKIVRALSRAFCGPDGQIAGHVGSVEDVTQSRADQQRLEEKRSRLATILEGTGAATFEWNVQTGETRVSANWASMTGNHPADFNRITTETWMGQLHPDDRPRMTETYQRHFADPTVPFEIEIRKRHMDGHWVWLMNRGRMTSTLPDGQPEWVSGVQFDITDRKRQEEALRKSESLLAKTGEVAGIGGWDLDLLTNTLSWTDQTCRIHGLAPGFKPDLSQAISFYAPPFRPVIEAAVAAAISSGQPWDLDLQLVRADGRLIWVRAVGAVDHEGDRPVRIYGAFQDIDERVTQQRQVQDEHRRMTLAKESGGIGIWEWEPDGDRLTWDRQMFRLYGQADLPDTAAVEVWRAGLHPEDRDAVAEATARTLENGERFDAEFRVIWPDGSERVLRSMADVADASDGQRKLIGVNWDVTEARANAQRLVDQHRLMQVTLRSIGDAVITTDGSGRVTWLNPVGEMMTGWPLAEAQGRPLHQIFRIINETTLLPVESPVSWCLARGEAVGMAAGTILISRDGREFGIEDSAAPIKDDNGTIHGVVMVFHDVTTERRLTGEMVYRATHDPLTGTKNRLEFEQRVEAALVRSKKDGSQHAVLFIDLDQFKLVNDACGHSAGDDVLQQVSKILSDSIRPCDTLARLGGDEFGILLERCPLSVGELIAQRICDQMETYRFAHGGRRFRVGASIGVVPVKADWPSIIPVMQAADACCIAAKEAGRNRVQAWQGSDAALMAHQGDKQWVARLERALEEDAFQLYAQPIVALAPHPMLRRVEILLRLKEGVTTILPGVFMPAAERFNLATRIDLWVLRQTIATLKTRSDMALFSMVNVNVSGKSVGDRLFHRQAVDLLRAAGNEICSRLTLEVTETAAIANIPDAAAFVEELHRLGVRVALDDFGAGATSFGYLRALKVDSLKIDGQFVQGLLKDDLSRATVRCFVEIAKVLGVPTVAEHVDDPSLVDMLGELGVDFAQGYLFGRPEPFMG